MKVSAVILATAAGLSTVQAQQGGKTCTKSGDLGCDGCIGQDQPHNWDLMKQQLQDNTLKLDADTLKCEICINHPFAKEAQGRCSSVAPKVPTISNIASHTAAWRFQGMASEEGLETTWTWTDTRVCTENPVGF
ncbi:hypothetical protein E5D57_004439 [Metarhizium anisopliae]|nr:hypothetical protein E5D57_004438 [Metarhizium anisopliae]KAF5133812.1 hypothetical protein E5D57_004439 [Metarhizium anisopliae]